MIRKKKTILLQILGMKRLIKKVTLNTQLNIPLSKIDKSIEEIRKWREKKVVVYSDKSDKTKDAIDKLTKQGFKDVSGAQNVKDFSYDLVKYTSLSGSKFQDALLNTAANNVFFKM